MNTFDRKEKESKLRQNVEVSTERELRQIEQREKRTRKPGEFEKLRKKWEKGARRVDETMLSKVWNPKESGSENPKRPEFGYFGGVNFDKDGKIIK